MRRNLAFVLASLLAAAPCGLVAGQTLEPKFGLQVRVSPDQGGADRILIEGTVTNLVTGVVVMSPKVGTSTHIPADITKEATDGSGMTYRMVFTFSESRMCADFSAAIGSRIVAHESATVAMGR